MTSAERRTLLFLAILICLGAGVRAVRVRREPAPDRQDALALATQLARIDSLRASAPRGRRGSAGARSAARPRVKAGIIDPAAPIDLDQANAEAVDRLPGIGRVVAERIVANRDSFGPFGSLDGLRRVRGVGPALAERLRPNVTFSGVARPANTIIGPGAPRLGLRAFLDTLYSAPDLLTVTAPAVPAADQLGDFLLQEGLVTREQLEIAGREERQHGTRLGYNLIKLGFVKETDMTRALGRRYRVPAVDLTRFELDARIAKLIPAELALKHRVLPLKREGRTLTLALADPSRLGVLEDIKFITGYDIYPVVAGEYTLHGLLEKHFESTEAQMDSLLEDLADAGEDIEVLEGEREDEVSTVALAALVDEAPVVRLINAILTEAVRRGASDIHFECFEHELRVRFRVDGALQEIMKPPLRMRAALISRFKIMSSLNIAERRVPQDGRIKLKIGSKIIDFRVSTLPTLFGEKVVLRILDKANLQLELEKFGIEPRAEVQLMEAVSNPYGMVLVTGPTGSGKTTTLYSALSKINSIDVNIMTAEDPVEYNLFGINQVQVRTEIGLTFAAALRAFLRQDPNIIMVGEIRDLDTGGIAIKAALTGHLVLSTLHTNSAPETVTRLMDMGLEPFNVATALNLVLAQRLVRRACSSCKEQYFPDDIEFAAAKVEPTTTLGDLRFAQEALSDARSRATKEAAPFLKNLSPKTMIKDLPFFRGAGCDQCANGGLRGRQGLYEVMFMTPGLRRMVLHNASAAEIRDHAISEGMLTLRMDGWLKILKGITTIEQVVRETSA
jgi:type IV pilus assembly protein PilB